MNDTEFLTQLMRFQDGALAPDDLAALESAMRDDPARRRLFAEAQLRSMALHDRFRQEAFQRGDRNPGSAIAGKRIAWIKRPLAALAAGLALGLFSASVVWAISSPKATTERLFSLLNGDFDEARLGRGFPRQTGLWSGDEAEVSGGVLRFIAPGSDAGDPGGRAIACDVFQIVDLRPLRPSLSAEGDSVIELSAEFVDARPPNTQPSVTFFCQIYVFQGDPAALQPSWPQGITEALASGSAQVTTLGTDAQGARVVTAKCLVPGQAEFAVVQLAARPNLRPARLDGLSVDHVKLTLRTQPSLPVRVVQMQR